MQTVGVKLRQEREQQKIRLDKIAEDTRINLRYLEAIEADDASALPGEFFYRAFIRQYAKYLGLSPDELERQISLSFKAEPAAAPTLSGYAEPQARLTQAEEDRQIRALRESLKDKPMRAPQDDGMSKRWLAFAAAVILTCIGYFSWPALQERLFATRKPVEVATTTPKPAEVKPAPPTNPATPPATTEAATPTPTTTETQPATTTAQPATPPPATAPPAAPARVEAGQFSLTLLAKEITWIRITADGTKVFGGTIDPGQSKTINAKSAEVIVGNAGTLDVIFNGKPIQFGNKGEVKTLLFSPEGWKYKPKAPPAENVSPTTTGASSAARRVPGDASGSAASVAFE